jgi:hypothetical protein
MFVRSPHRHDLTLMYNSRPRIASRRKGRPPQKRYPTFETGLDRVAAQQLSQRNDNVRQVGVGDVRIRPERVNELLATRP